MPSPAAGDKPAKLQDVLNELPSLIPAIKEAIQNAATVPDLTARVAELEERLRVK